MALAVATDGIEVGPELDQAAVFARHYVPGHEHLPEELRPREFGRNVRVLLPITAPTMLTQTRKDTNKAFGNLKQSIDSTDLQSEPMLAQLDKEQLREYIRFTNRIWGVRNRITSHKPYDDGWHYLVIAGHTRMLAMQSIEEDRMQAIADAELEPGEPAQAWFHLHYAPSPEKILTLQLDENIHEKVPEEQLAVAIVESYMYGIEKKKWGDEKEFVAANKGKFNERQVTKALAFARLPKEFRDIIVLKGVPYVLGIEVAEIGEAYLERVLRKYYDGAQLHDLPKDQQTGILKDQRNWMGRELVQLQLAGKRVNITAYRKKTDSYKTAWAEAEDDSLYEQNSLLAEFESSQLAQYRREQMTNMNEYAGALRELDRMQTEGAAVAVAAHIRNMRSTGMDDEVEDMLDSFAVSREKYKDNVIGYVAVNGAKKVGDRSNGAEQEEAMF